MKIIPSSIEFYIGAATRGEGTGKWTWPGRDLPFIYQRKFRLGSDCSVEPDLATWRQYGLVVCHFEGHGTRMMSVEDFVTKVVGEQTALEYLQKCPGVYIQEQKHAILDRLGCPR